MASITYRIISVEKGNFKSNEGIYLKVEKTIKSWFKPNVTELHVVFGENSHGDNYNNWYYTSTGVHLKLDDYAALIKCTSNYVREYWRTSRVRKFKSDGF